MVGAANTGNSMTNSGVHQPAWHQCRTEPCRSVAVATSATGLGTLRTSARSTDALGEHMPVKGAGGQDTWLRPAMISGQRENIDADRATEHVNSWRTVANINSGVHFYSHRYADIHNVGEQLNSREAAYIQAFQYMLEKEEPLKQRQ